MAVLLIDNKAINLKEIDKQRTYMVVLLTDKEVVNSKEIDGQGIHTCVQTEVRVHTCTDTPPL